MYISISEELPGQYRCAGHFMDGINVRPVVYVQGSIRVCDHKGNALWSVYVADKIGNFYPRSIGCIRSAQSGTLVVIMGGFYPDVESGQRFVVIGTEYKILPPATFQG